MSRPTSLMTATVVLAAAGTANAYVNTIYDVADDPGVTFGAPIASLDVATTAYDWEVITAGKKDSGYKAEILDPNGNPLILDGAVNPNVFQLRTDVYAVGSATTVGTINGGLDLLPGDLVFAYRIQMVGDSDNTIETLQDFGVNAATGLIGAQSAADNGPFANNTALFDASIILARGVTTDGLANPTANLPQETLSDFDSQDFGLPTGGFSQVDFTWPVNQQAAQISNEEEVTLLVFARGAIISDGFAKLAGVPGQAGTTTSTIAAGAPLLIPAVPSPGATALLIGAGLVGSTRRRR